MPRVGITYESTVSAINSLLAAGQTPTIDRIRSELGDTGSRSTINKYLRKWKKEERPAVIPGSGQSAEMPDLVSVAVNKVIQEKYEEARAEYGARLESAEADTLALEQSLSEAEEENKAQLAQIHELESTITAERMQSERLTDEMKVIKEQSHITIVSAQEKAEQERKGAELARIETAELRLKLTHYEELKEEIREFRKELKAAITATATADKEAGIAMARHEELESSIAAERAQTERLSDEIEAIKQQSQITMRSAEEKAQKDMRDLRGELKVAVTATASAEKEAAAATAKYEGSAAQIKTLEHALKSVEKQLEKK